MTDSSPTHLSYGQISRRQVDQMDLKEVFRFVAPRVRDAAIKSAEQLNALGIRHALAGELAVGAHGYIRATVDVDFLVGEEAFEHHGSVVAFKAGVPIEVDGVRIDYLSPVSLGAQLEEVLDHPPMNEGLAVVPIEVLIYMKLTAKRRRDPGGCDRACEGGCRCESGAGLPPATRRRSGSVV